ncbi:CPBP family intramembrane glutamic endopeptidase [Antrihabitans stalactiti]|uniref:CPBP family intramembrane metalloprotease n=1 Tax=Antrihabitans stalactiti TaxID=2584121 RepID=A0A848KDX2_9NOCA|nr:CPBP family intramembrane glutamic endopeptidase [Antrihabitans stalactiti]NMN97113.1 CPBP family intramembrane metalloprotease [Antrihabitans stalactiti]
MTGRVVACAAIAVPLLWSNWALPAAGLGPRGRTFANACFATGYGLALGRRVPWLTRDGLVVGAAAAVAPLAGYGVVASLPAARAAVGEAPRDDLAEWTLVHIPIGTVYAEELIFRGTLDPLLENVFGPQVGGVLGAATFGLWHIQPARVAEQNVVGTVVATSLAGLVFGWLRHRGGSVVAPALLHFALNVGGAVLASKVQS